MPSRHRPENTPSPVISRSSLGIRVRFQGLRDTRKGKPPVFDEDGASQFLESFAERAAAQERPMTVVELRDRAVCAVMTYAFLRIGSVCGMKVEDYYQNGKTWYIRFDAKGGKHQELPCHHKLAEYLDAYIKAAEVAGERKGWLFRSSRGRTKQLTENALRTDNAWKMVQRRAKDAGVNMRICNHSFRGTGITNYLANGGQLSHAQDMASHSDPRTTRLYDHSGNQATLDEIERIQI